MNKKYKNSPIIEAVCEFRFAPSLSWDPTIPGVIYEKIKDIFPKKRRVQIQEFTFTAEEKGMKQEVKTSERAQFLHEEEKIFMQVGQDVLSVHHLKPYSSWSNFYTFIVKAFNTYREIANPTGIQRIGLRYINRMEIPKEPIEIEGYFNFRPYIGENMPQEISSIFSGAVFNFEGGKHLMKVQLKDIPMSKPSTGLSAFIFDMDYFTASPGSVNIEDIENWLNIAHERIEKIFEEALTEETKKLFN